MAYTVQDRLLIERVIDQLELSVNATTLDSPETLQNALGTAEPLPTSDNTSPVVILLAPPASDDLTTVSDNDLRTFIGSGAEDFIAYRVDNNTSYAIWPCSVSEQGLVTGSGTYCRIDTSSGSRVVTYGEDSINMQLDSMGYYYSDMRAPYITAYPNSVVNDSAAQMAPLFVMVCLAFLVIKGVFSRD